MILKQLFCTLLIGIFSYLLCYNIIERPSLLSAEELKKKHPTILDAKNVVILWDLHQVVFDRSLLHWAYLFFTHVKFVSIVRHLNMATFTIMMKFVLRKMKLNSEEITSQELIIEANKANNVALIDLIRLISCDYYPNQAVVAIINELNQKHITQHVGSNIAQAIFGPFSEQYPEIFALFSHYQIIEGDRLPIAKKPNALFFQRYLQDTHQLPNHIIFIDDRAANVATAQQENLIGIHFTSTPQLKKDLQTLGIFLP